MRTVDLYDKGEEVLVRGKITDVAMDNGDIVYQVVTVDNGKNMGVWLKNDQLVPVLKHISDPLPDEI